MWGTPTCVWDDPVTGPQTQWNNFGPMDLWRRMPRTSLRSDFFQLQMVPAYLAVYSSSQSVWPVGALAKIADGDATTKIVTILTPAGYTSIVWPNDVVGYELALSIDNYTAKYPITVRAGGADQNKIIISDPSNVLPIDLVTVYQWEIWGYKKEQRTTLTSYLINFTFYGDQVQGFPGRFTTSGPGNSGENPS